MGRRHGATIAMCRGAVLLVLVVALGSCDAGDEDPSGEATIGPTGAPTTPEAPATTDAPAATTTSEGDRTEPIAGESVIEIADAIGCAPAFEDPEGIPVEAGEPLPVEVAECYVGERGSSIQRYADERDVEAVLEVSAPYCGIRVVGPTWIAVVNTPEMGEIVARRTGGRLTILPGCDE